MRLELFDHRRGLAVVDERLLDDVVSSISDSEVLNAPGNAPILRAEVLQRLVGVGWSGEVGVSVGSDITITSVKGEVGLCLQTGNYARTYADLLKLQKLFLDGTIYAGVVVVLSIELARVMGDNLANSARLVKELKIFSMAITCPIVIASIEE